MKHLHHRSTTVTRTRSTRTLLFVSLSLGLVTALTACGSSHPASQESVHPTVSVSPSSSPTPDPTTTAKQAVLITYQGFWNTQVQAYTQGSFDGIQVEKYTRDNADYLLRTGLQYYVQQGLVMRGRPALSPQVTALNLGAKMPTATITDCVDTTNYYPVNKTTGKPAQLTSTVHRHPGSYSAVFEGGQWWITNGAIDRTKTC
jgi:hypothetical protein